jgi:hypothetical protein
VHFADLQADASRQLSVYRYATAMNGRADQEDLRLRFDVLTKTKQPELCRSWTQRDRAANLRLFRLVAGVLHAIEAGVFHPNPGWQCKDCPFQTGAGRGGRRAPPGKAMHAMMRVIPRSGSRKVNG